MPDRLIDVRIELADGTRGEFCTYSSVEAVQWLMRWYRREPQNVDWTVRVTSTERL